MPFEILDGFFVFLRPGLAVERAEISAFSSLRVFLSRIQPVLARFDLPNHDSINYSQINGFRGLIGQMKRLPYKGLTERFEKPSASNAARIARLVARWEAKLQCWLA